MRHPHQELAQTLGNRDIESMEHLGEFLICRSLRDEEEPDPRHVPTPLADGHQRVEHLSDLLRVQLDEIQGQEVVGVCLNELVDRKPHELRHRADVVTDA